MYRERERETERIIENFSMISTHELANLGHSRPEIYLCLLMYEHRKLDRFMYKFN